MCIYLNYEVHWSSLWRQDKSMAGKHKTPAWPFSHVWAVRQRPLLVNLRKCSCWRRRCSACRRTTGSRWSWLSSWHSPRNGSTARPQRLEEEDQDRGLWNQHDSFKVNWKIEEDRAKDGGRERTQESKSVCLSVRAAFHQVTFNSHFNFPFLTRVRLSFEGQWDKQKDELTPIWSEWFTSLNTQHESMLRQRRKWSLFDI